jgi:hypothetical protein
MSDGAQGGKGSGGGVQVPHRVGDPVVEQPLLFEGEDGQEQVFVDVFEVLAPPDTFRIERLRDERFELSGSVHC